MAISYGSRNHTRKIPRIFLRLGNFWLLGRKTTPQLIARAVGKQLKNEIQTTMGIKEYLDKSLNKYYLGILKENGFELTESDFSAMAGIYRFKNNWLNFDIVNDRGIIETRISSLYSENFYDLDLITAYLNRRNKKEMENPRFGKYDLSVRLTLEQESELFKSNLTELKTMFNKLNYKQTESELNKIGDERAKLLFG
tara:strand:+ start:324 stop:914 length:591 start_codon:yes stop_codon:yes gene_type:complete